MKALSVTLSVKDAERAIVRLTFVNHGDTAALIDRRQACMRGFVPLGAFRMSRPRRFIGRRVTAFGDAPHYYQVLAPGERVDVEVPLAVDYESLGEPLQVSYRATHATPDASVILTLESEPVQVLL